MKQISFTKINQVVKVGGKIVFFFLILFYVLLNIFFSQNISPLYFQLAKENKTAAVNFLSQIKNHSLFDSFLSINKNVYGDSLEQEVFAESLKRKQSIKDYEQLLQDNPNSRDILYNLYILYLEEGNKLKADEFLTRAKDIDPSLDQ